jgi:ribosome-associated heat shock protein Hsp15
MDKIFARIRQFLHPAKGWPQRLYFCPMAGEKIRIDKYLWAIRLFKTRSLASEALDKGKVKWHGESVKASRAVKVGDEYHVKTAAKNWVIRVDALLDNRVAYSEAIKHYSDLTPAEEITRVAYEASSFHTGKRLSKVGRPTKKEKRDLDDFFEQPE